MKERAPKNVKVEVTCHSHTPGIVVPIEGDAMRLAAEAVEIGFGKKPAMMREGGSIPVVNLLKRELGVDTLLLGFGLPDDRVHSPNEKFDLGRPAQGRANRGGAVREACATEAIAISRACPSAIQCWI
jgi:acetylornithine deacetylase/succinyl-diaminopimelate desuccinylase-like protein